MRKHLSLILTGILSLLMLSACGGDQEVRVPEFEKAEKGIMFGAYCAPTVNNSIEGLTDQYEKLAEAGFNKAYPLREGDYWMKGSDIYESIELRSAAAEQDALKVLELAEAAGIQYYVKDSTFTWMADGGYEGITTEEEFDKVLAKMFDENNRYIDHPAYAGQFGRDEPNLQQLEMISWQIKAYNKYVGRNGTQGGEVFVNLWPCFVSDNSSNLSVNCDVTYREYVDYYFEHLAPHLGYVCWDFYPLRTFPGTEENYVREMYYYNHELMAQKCKEGGYEMRTFVQAVGDYTGIRNILDISDFRFQIYSGMAFGVREFNYYHYGATDLPETDPTEAPVELGYGLYNCATGEYNYTYYFAKEVNAEIHAIEDVYQAYDWEGVMYKNADPYVDNQLFANLVSPLDSHKRIKSWTATQDTLIGTFTAKDESFEAQDAFMIVNSTEPSAKLSDEVTLTFNDASALLVCEGGAKNVVYLDKNASYTFTLSAGEGKLVIPLK